MRECDLEILLQQLCEAIRDDLRKQAYEDIKKVPWNKVKEVQMLKKLAKKRDRLSEFDRELQREQDILRARLFTVIKPPKNCKIDYGKLVPDDRSIWEESVRAINHWRVRVQVSNALKDPAIKAELLGVLKKYKII